MYKLNLISKDDYVNNWIADDRKNLTEIIHNILLTDINWKNVVKVEIINQLNEQEKIVIKNNISLSLHQLMIMIKNKL